MEDNKEYLNQDGLASLVNVLMNYENALMSTPLELPNLEKIEINQSWKDYDLVFFLAKPISGTSTYTPYPLSYIIPAKQMCEAVGNTGAFDIQVVDDMRWTVFECSGNYDPPFCVKARSAYGGVSNQGEIVSIYGIKLE